MGKISARFISLPLPAVAGPENLWYPALSNMLVTSLWLPFLRWVQPLSGSSPRRSHSKSNDIDVEAESNQVCGFANPLFRLTASTNF